MKRIRISQDNDRDWSRCFMDATNYDRVFDEDIFLEREDGSPLLALRKRVIPPDILANAWAIFRKIRGKTENRGTATGTVNTGRKKQNGEISKVMRAPKGWEVSSAIIGYFEREVRRPMAHPTAWTAENFALFQQLYPYFHFVSDIFQTTVPERFAIQKDWCDRTPADWVIPGSVFTTATVNHNFRTAAHKDAGDLAEGFSCMTYFRAGQFSGGELVLPNYRVAVRLDTGDQVMFDAHEFHGNTQIVPMTEVYDRCTVVHYYRTDLIRCKSAAEEVAQAKNRKPGTKLYDD